LTRGGEKRCIVLQVEYGHSSLPNTGWRKGVLLKKERGPPLIREGEHNLKETALKSHGTLKLIRVKPGLLTPKATFS